MPQLFNQHFIKLGIGCIAGVLIASTANAQLNSIIQTETQINNNAQRTQQRITNLAEQTQDLVSEYRAVVNETNSLRVYNEQLQKVVQDQRDERNRITTELEGLEDTNRGVVPLMIDMVDTLRQVVEADIPFHREDRSQWVADLRDMIDRSDVTTSEKYRRIMEAYQRELEYGRSTEAYRGTLPNGNVVDFLRVGRTLLLYQSQDGKETGWWDSSAGDFAPLGDSYRLEVKEGIAIAKNEKPPNLVVLPVPAPEGAQ